VWRVIYGAEPETIPNYAPDWAEASGEETLRNAASRHLVAIPTAEATAGDVLIFRMSPRAPAKHCGIATGPDSMVHAWSRHAVAEVALGRYWQRRLAFGFRFPEVK